MQALASSRAPLSALTSSPSRSHLQAAEAAAAEAAAAAGGVAEAEHAALAGRCKELERKFAVARKKIQVGLGLFRGRAEGDRAGEARVWLPD
jgi:hypothetical protein